MERHQICFNCGKKFYNKQNHPQIFCSRRCRIEGWSRKFKKCVKCGTTEIPHSRFGYCRKCAWYLPQVQSYVKKYRKSLNYKKKKKIWDKKYSNSEKGRTSHFKAIKKYIKTEKGKLKYKKYRETEKGRMMFLVSAQRRRARLKNAGDLKREDFEFIIKRDNLVCQLCGKTLNKKEVTFDHIIPLIKNGKHSIDNLQVTCLSCNVKKNINDNEKFKDGI